MVFDVPSELLERVRATGQIDRDDFLGVIQNSLPELYDFCSYGSADHVATRPLTNPSAPQNLQIYRGMASIAIRRALESHFNCVLVMPSPTEIRMAGSGVERRDLWRKNISIRGLVLEYPGAYPRLEFLRDRLRSGENDPIDDGNGLSESAQRDLLLLHAVDPFRAAIEDELGMEIAFQLPRASIAKKKGNVSPAFDEFCTPVAQILNLTPQT